MTEDTVRPTGDAPPDPAAGWTLVLPVKPLPLAKSRLAAFAGARRPRLALAFALDTVTAALCCPLVARVLVVTRDELAGGRLAELGAHVVGGEPGGLNPALEHGERAARRLAPGAPVATLSADLPALRPAELARVLAAAPAGRAFLPDAPGTGTVLLASSSPGTALRPAFGPGSRAAHAAAGARELTLSGVASVRRDVDTPEDLREALRLGVGAHTAALL